MTYLQDLKGVSVRDPVKLECDGCGKHYSILYGSAKKTFKKNGRHSCYSCAPHNSKAFWTEERKIRHGQSVKSSDAYYAAIPHRELSGEKNGMYGRKHTKSTRKKMSKARIGKLGPNATAWKGGKLSLTRRVKGVIHHRFNWYFKVFQRDSFKCVECGSKTKLDAHHIEPVVNIIRRLCEGRTFDTDEQKIEWLVAQPDIRDRKLNNGKTLCRVCHKQEHKNWGSHINP